MPGADTFDVNGDDSPDYAIVMDAVVPVTVDDDGDGVPWAALIGAIGVVVAAILTASLKSAANGPNVEARLAALESALGLPPPNPASEPATNADRPGMSAR